MISDVSGAGDTTIATFAAAISGGASLKEAAIIANYAAELFVRNPVLFLFKVRNCSIQLITESNLELKDISVPFAFMNNSPACST